MLVVISPAKNIEISERTLKTISAPHFNRDANNLALQLQNFSCEKIKQLMGISSSLAKLNHERYLNWTTNPSQEDIKQALLTFKGQVYIGIDADNLSDRELEEAQNRLRIISGLYGLLRPLDGILPYRLEMGTKWHTPQFKNLYEYWGNRVTAFLTESIIENKHKALVNLASNEYFKVIKPKSITVPTITPIFKDNRGNGYKIISTYAKKARGLMTRFIIKNQLTNTEDLKAFDCEGYYYNNKLSTIDKPVFTREH